MTNGALDTLGPTRRQVLVELRQAPNPIGAAAVAHSIGLHANGARFHLEALVDSGLAERVSEERSSRGRPKVLYAAVPAVGAEVDGYRDLAEVLVEALAVSTTESGSSAAEAAGVARGRRVAAELIETRADDGLHAATADRAGDLLVDGLARLGFESRSVATSRGRRIDITPCPYLDLARAHPDVVCAVHRGLMSGVLEESGAPLEVAELEPFARADRCVARLRSA